MTHAHVFLDQIKLTFWVFIGRSDVIIFVTVYPFGDNELSNMRGVHIDDRFVSVLIRLMVNHITV